MAFLPGDTKSLMYKAIEEKKAAAPELEKKIAPLLKELGKDEPAYRKIAEGLANQGIASLRDIQYTKTPKYETQQITYHPRGISYEDGTTSDPGWYSNLTNRKVFDINDPKIAELKAKGEWNEGTYSDGEGGFYTIYGAKLPTGEFTESWTNKATGKPITNYRFGMLGNGEGGISGGDLFFSLKADDKGAVSIAPDWSPRKKSEFKEIAFPLLAIGSLVYDWSGTTGAAILGAGSAAAGLELAGTIAAGITSATGVAVSAGAITAGIGTAALTTGVTYATTGNFATALKAGGLALAGGIAGSVAGGAAAAALPAGASSTVTQFVTNAVSSGTSTAIQGGDASQILTNAFASGASAGIRDATTSVVGENVAKGLGAATSSFIKTGNLEKAAITGLMSGFGSAVKDSNKNVTGIGGNVDDSQFSSAALEELKNVPDLNAEVGIKSLDTTPAVDTKTDENGLGQDLTVNTRADENGIGSLNPNAPVETDVNAAVETAPIENPKDIKQEGIASLEPKDNISEPADAVKDEGLGSLSPKELQTVYDQENPGAANVDVETANTVTIDGKEYFLNNEGGASVQNPDGSYTNLNAEEFAALGEPDEVQSDGTLDTVTVTGGNDVVIDDSEGGFDNYTPEVDVNAPLELPPGAEPDEEKPEEPYLLNPDEPVKNLPKVPPIFPPVVKPPVKPPVTPPVTPPVKPPETPADTTGLSGLIAGLVAGTTLNQSNDSSPPPEKATDLTGGYTFNWDSQDIQNPVNGIAYGQEYFKPHWKKTMINDYAEGGLMALDKTMESPTFKPTIGDGGIKVEDLSTNNIANQALQHLRRGGHVIDHKLHSSVSYLANKGEPVHHIVGFMNHQKRMAEGGIASTSLGSYSDGGHLLKGPGDGMSDDIPAVIADKQPARLANEEFVIPADVVSHLGNGSSESGAKVLYEMMARIRKARTGNPKQGKQIDPHKLLPKV
jgi:hypothetical protein